MEFLHLLGWIAVSILVPVLAPIIFLLLPKIPPKTRPYADGLVAKAVKDGQLFWVTIALCAVGYYELSTYMRLLSGELAHAVAIAGIVVLALISVVSMVLVVLQAVDIPNSGLQSEAPCDQRLLRTSIGLLALSVLVVGTAHYFIAAASETAKLISEQAARDLISCRKVIPRCESGTAGEGK